MLNLFARLQPDAGCHPQFLTLRDSALYEPARMQLNEICRRFTDPDGNFVQQFQTHGFDARTFEIFLFAMLEEQGHAIDRSHDRPDFIIERDGTRVAVEAVTANPSPTPEIQPYDAIPPEMSQEELHNYRRHELAIRLGSPLYTKLKKRYWELPHASGLPLVLAIQDFHRPGSLMMSSTSLGNYLYGSTQRWYHDDDGELVISEVPLESHKAKKEIPSGFFRQPEAHNISAVLFSNSGTITKFNRMGHEGAFSSRNVRMLRHGTCYRPDPNAVLPEPFLYEVGDPEEGRETWREGTMLIRNPWADRPLPEEWFGAGAEEDLVDGRVVTTFRESFLPYWSITIPFPSETHASIIQEHADSIAAALSAQFPPTVRTR